MNKQKEKMIDKIQMALLSEMELIREDKTRTIQDKLEEIDVLNDTIKFLDNYEENIEILNNHIRGMER